MGYHSNEATTKKAVNDAQRFINDRARLEQALRLTLDHVGIGSQERDAIVEDVKRNRFVTLAAALHAPTAIEHINKLIADFGKDEVNAALKEINRSEREKRAAECSHDWTLAQIVGDGYTCYKCGSWRPEDE